MLDFAYNSSLEPQIAPMLRAAFPGTAVWFVALDLMACKCVEIRGQALKLLLVLLADNTTGRLNKVQVTYNLLSFLRVSRSILLSCCCCDYTSFDSPNANPYAPASPVNATPILV